MSNAFLNGVTFGYSPDGVVAYVNIPEINSFSGIGKTNPLVDVTNFDSAGREYIAGLADGKEVTMECNYLPGDTVQIALETAVDNGSNVFFEVIFNDGTTTETYEFEVTALEWEIGPQFDEKNTRNFTFKISGGITKS